jgi:hypothetical protein
MALLRKVQSTPGLRASPVFGYIRKSKTEADKQVMSLEEQREAIVAFVASRGWGQVDLWFSDELTAKDFDRPGFSTLMATCAANMQRGKPGHIVVLDYDRFARPVDKNIKVDDIEYQRQRVAIHDAGFEIDYALTPKSGNSMQDALVGAMKVAMSGEYIEKLSIRSRAGKRKVGMNGYWAGGPAPFPADRYDARTGRRLDRGERASNGQSVLGPPADGTRLQHWIDCAHMLLAGHSFDALGRELNARGVESFFKGNWRRGSIARMFVNPALIGRVEYEFRKDDTTTEVFEGPAQWEPIVPVDLFRAVRAEVEGRHKPQRARPNRDFPLMLECFHCGARYTSVTLKPCANTGWKLLRCYIHPAGERNMNEILLRRSEKAGCKAWRVRAEQIEPKIRDLIIAQRGSKSFAQVFADLVKEQGAINSHTEQMEKDAERQVKTIERKRNNLREQLEDAEDAETRTYLLARITELTRELMDAQSAWKQARSRREQGTELNDELLRLVEEAQNIKEAWATDGDEGVERRRAIVDTWIDKILIEGDPTAYKGKPCERKIYVYLRTAPNTPMALELNHQWKNEARASFAVPHVITEFRLAMTGGLVCAG